MPIIKPISDLRNKSGAISDLVHSSSEPVFITRNGEGDMVVMSMAQYSQLQLRVTLADKLSTAQANFAKGDRGRSLTDVTADLRDMIDESNAA